MLRKQVKNKLKAIWGILTLVIFVLLVLVLIAVNECDGIANVVNTLGLGDAVAVLNSSMEPRQVEQTINQIKAIPLLERVELWGNTICPDGSNSDDNACCPFCIGLLVPVMSVSLSRTPMVWVPLPGRVTRNLRDPRSRGVKV